MTLALVVRWTVAYWARYGRLPGDGEWCASGAHLTWHPDGHGSLHAAIYHTPDDGSDTGAVALCMPERLVWAS